MDEQKARKRAAERNNITLRKNLIQIYSKNDVGSLNRSKKEQKKKSTEKLQLCC